MHVLGLLLHIVVLGFQHQGLISLLTQEFDQGFVFGQSLMCLKQFKSCLFSIAFSQQFACLGKNSVDQLPLGT